MKRYIDASENRAFGLLLLDDEGKPVDIVLAGISVSQMPPSERREEYIQLEQQGIYFFFGEDVPPINFYTVPKVDLFATDGKGGYWGTVGTITDVTDLESPVCYIDKERHAFKVAANLQSLLFPLETVAKRLQHREPITGIAFFNSLAEAEEQYDFFDLNKISPQESE